MKKAYERRVEVQGEVLQGKSIQSADSELTAKLLSANLRVVWPNLYQLEFGLLQFSHRPWTDVLRRGACGWFWAVWLTVHLTVKNRYIAWNGSQQAKRLREE
jgi:hypothetical protein